MTMIIFIDFLGWLKHERHFKYQQITELLFKWFFVVIVRGMFKMFQDFIF